MGNTYNIYDHPWWSSKTIYNLKNCLFAQYIFIYHYTCTLYHLVKFSLSTVIVHSTFHIIIAQSHFFILNHCFHFTCFLYSFPCYMLLITISIIFFITSYVLCLALISKKWIMGIICMYPTVLSLYETVISIYMTQTRLL